MRRPLLVGLALVLALGACGSRLNPLNWIGGSEPAPATLAPTDLPATAPDARPLIAQVISLEVEPNRGCCGARRGRASDAGLLERRAGGAAGSGWRDDL